jgi:ABC-type uncharacterized transport system ATPase subunit
MLDSGRLVIAGLIDSLRHDSTDVLVRVDGNQQQFIQALGQRGVQAQANGLDIVVARESDEVFDTIRDTVVESGFVMRQLRPRERSLEDVYIQTVSGLAESAVGTDDGD